MKSGDDPWQNLLWVNEVVQEADRKNLDLVVFPENTFYRGADAQMKRQLVLRETKLGLEGPWAKELRNFAKNWQTAVVIGSHPLHSGGKYFNSSLLFEKGQLKQHYDKIHLFRYQSPRGEFNEEQDYQAGKELAVFSVKSFKIGMSICYDLRFPELYRQLSVKRACQVLLVPAAFLMQTGQAHWELLLRARAVENQCFVVAPAQWGKSQLPTGVMQNCYGNSLVVDPWGGILAKANTTGNQFLQFNLDLQLLKQLRTQLPVFLEY